MTNRLPIIDPNRAALLADAGAPGWIACLAIGRDGNQTAWLIGPGDPGLDVFPYPDHERGGVMPIEWLRRTWKCNTTITAGRPCTRDPKRGQARCWQHQPTTEDTQ